MFLSPHLPRSVAGKLEDEGDRRDGMGEGTILELLGAASAPAPAQDPSNSQRGQVVGINIQHMVRQVMRRKTLRVGVEKERQKEIQSQRQQQRERETARDRTREANQRKRNRQRDRERQTGRRGTNSETRRHK